MELSQTKLTEHEIGHVKFLLITANAGTLFEELEAIKNGWISEILKEIERCRPDFFVLHIQELGGKDYENCMCYVHDFILDFQKKCSNFGLNKGYAFLDENYEDFSEFTALGSIYLCHDSIAETVNVWDFAQNSFTSCDKFTIIDKDIKQSSLFEKVRFSQEFVPEMVFTRKGYMRTRWRISDLVVDFVNVHLFHDGCNLLAVEKPQRFSSYRRRGLENILSHLENQKSQPKTSLKTEGKEYKEGSPLFIFGDFNFRLNTRRFVQRLTHGTVARRLSKKGKDKSPTIEQINGLGDLTNGIPTQDLALEFQRKKSSETILRLKKKGFDYEHHELLPENWRLYKSDDRELEQFPEMFECDLEFPPTYPWTEETKGPMEYMRTRPPAWCDRVIMNGTSWQLTHPGHSDSGQTSPEYGDIGRNTCMGDHKPVFLFCEMPCNVKGIQRKMESPFFPRAEIPNSPLEEEVRETFHWTTTSGDTDISSP